MAESTVCKVIRDGTITIADLAGTNSYTIAFETGDFTAATPGRTVNVFLDRNQLTTTPCVRYGDEAGSSGSFTCYLRDATDAATETALDFINQSGFVGSTWVSTLGATAEVLTVSIAIAIADPDVADHTITYNHCNITGSFAEGDPSSITINWQSYELYPTVT
jgi:hypothetical protein